MKLAAYAPKKVIRTFTGKNSFIWILSVTTPFFTGCENEPVGISYPVPEIVVDTSTDPKSSGLIESQYCLTGVPGPPFDFTALPDNYPPAHDLSDLMPQVESQGPIGSCTAWATTYYLKSYQEKIQHNSSFYDTSNTMSPLYVYNHTKASNDCEAGACLVGSLEFLKTRGAVPSNYFHYGLTNCSLIPPISESSLWPHYKIASYHRFLFSDAGDEDEIITKGKKLLYDGKPLVIAMSLDKKFANAIPRNEQNLYIYKEHDPSLYWASHAMLVVGYNDALKAFKVVNSWGKNWGNEGYCWISYGFFKKHTSPDYKIGLGEVWFAIDE